MSNPMYPPPPPGGFAPPQQPQYPAQQPQYGAPPQQTGWTDNRTIIGGWAAEQYGMQKGKHIEYKVMQQPTNKGGIFKTVKFFRPYLSKKQEWRDGDAFAFNQMKELVEKINHFIQMFCEEKGFFVWQPGATTQQQAPQGQPQYPPQGQPMQPAPQYPPQQPVYGAPQYPPQQQQPVQQSQPQSQPAPGYPPPPGGVVWP